MCGWIGHQFFFDAGNDVEAMLRRARCMNALLSAGLGLLVYAWSRRLFGPGGGMLSLLLYATNPAVLANGSLATTDMAAAAFFTASVGCLWRMFHKVSLGTLLCLWLALAGLFLSKVSAGLIVPMGAALLTVRLAARRPLFVGESRSMPPGGRPNSACCAASWRFKRCWSWPRFGPSMAFAIPPSTSRSPEIGRVPCFAEAVPRRVARPRNKRTQARSRPPSPPDFNIPWKDSLATTGAVGKAIGFLADHRLLPQAYLDGLLVIFQRSQSRSAFLNGQSSETGWRSFYPYAFLVKTPLLLFAVMILAGIAAAWGWRARERGLAPSPRSANPSETDCGDGACPPSRHRRRHTGRQKRDRRRGSDVLPAAKPTCATVGQFPFFRQPRANRLREAFYATAPLWILLAVYWCAAINSHLDIGHRHILPTYPAMFILAGAAAHWFRRGGRAGWIASAAVSACVLGLILDCGLAYPNYLAYFNSLAGGPQEGYKHLVDSSLDWGQDLPGLKRWLKAHDLDESAKTRVYLAYFGTSSPAHYHIRATDLCGLNVRPLDPLTEGVYCISATSLQCVYQSAPAPWTAADEQKYQRAAFKPWKSSRPRRPPPAAKCSRPT